MLWVACTSTRGSCKRSDATSGLVVHHLEEDLALEESVERPKCGHSIGSLRDLFEDGELSCLLQGEPNITTACH